MRCRVSSGVTARYVPNRYPYLELSSHMLCQRLLAMNTYSFKEGGPHVVSVTLNADDHLKIDNTRWRVVDVASEMKVLIVEGDRGIGQLAGSGSFLETR